MLMHTRVRWREGRIRSCWSFLSEMLREGKGERKRTISCDCEREREGEAYSKGESKSVCVCMCVHACVCMCVCVRVCIWVWRETERKKHIRERGGNESLPLRPIFGSFWSPAEAICVRPAAAQWPTSRWRHARSVCNTHTHIHRHRHRHRHIMRKLT